MDRQCSTHWTEARVIIRGAAGRYLIVKPRAGDDAPWVFPGGRVPPRSADEAFVQQVCHERLGVRLSALARQEPFTHGSGTHRVTYHYFVSQVVEDEALPLGYAELRWVPVTQLGEYLFDAPTRHVVDRLLAGPAR